MLRIDGRDKYKYKFPGGHILDTENFKESAQRETLEEISCKVNIKGEPIFYLHKLDDSLHLILVHYLADIVEGKPLPTTEIKEVGWFDLNNLPDNVFDNVIIILTQVGNQVI